MTSIPVHFSLIFCQYLFGFLGSLHLEKSALGIISKVMSGILDHYKPSTIWCLFIESGFGVAGVSCSLGLAKKPRPWHVVLTLGVLAGVFRCTFGACDRKCEIGGICPTTLPFPKDSPRTSTGTLEGEGV